MAKTRYGISVSTKRQTPDKYHVIVAGDFVGHRTSKGADCHCEPEVVTPNGCPDIRLYIHQIKRKK